jgi:hypothetical protein
MDVGLFWREHPDVRVIYDTQHKFGGLEYEHVNSRNMLVVTMLLGGQHILRVIINHWASQGAGEEGNELRASAAYQLRNLAAQFLSDPRQPQYVVALGDFNTLEDEQNIRGEHPFRDILCREHGPMTMVDLFTQPKFKLPGKQPPGSYFYKGDQTWNRLDRIFVSRNMLSAKSPVRIKRKSFGIIAPQEITRPYRMEDGTVIDIPWGYNWWEDDPAEAGFTDHFPIQAVIEFDIPEKIAGPLTSFKLDEEILMLNSVILYSKRKGPRKFITWREFQENEEAIRDGTWGTGNWEMRSDSLDAFNRKPDYYERPDNEHFGSLRRQVRKAPKGGNWQGAKWAKFVEMLSDPAKAQKVRITTDRKIPREWIYQSLVYLWDEGHIDYLPKLENIHTGYYEE